MRNSSITVSSIVIILLLNNIVYAQLQTPQLMIGSISKSPTISSLTYQVMIPHYPSVNSSGGFEFHAGMIDGQNATFIKSTISYGCQVSTHKGCFPPYLNRFVFYISIIDVSSQFRTQYPGSGYVVTSGTNYTISFIKTNCVLHIQGWTFSIYNSTKTFSTRVCMINQNFIYPISGMLEMHNVTSCDTQLPSSHSFTQSNYLINSQPISSWSLIEVNPYINCNFTNTYSGDKIYVGWS